MNDNSPSRRQFLRQGLTLAGVSFAWSSLMRCAFGADNTTAAAIPRANVSNPDQALQELNAAIRQNVLLNVEQLRNSEPVMAGLVRSNKVRVVGGIDDLATGRVTVLT